MNTNFITWRRGVLSKFYHKKEAREWKTVTAALYTEKTSNIFLCKKKLRKTIIFKHNLIW